MKNPRTIPNKQYQIARAALIGAVLAGVGFYSFKTVPPKKALSADKNALPPVSGQAAEPHLPPPGSYTFTPQIFHTESPSSWTPDLAKPRINDRGGFSFAHAKGHYTADISSEGISIRFGDIVHSNAPPFRLGLKSPSGTKPQIRANADAIEIGRGAITEWYRNSPAGVEQGFTIEHPLANSSEKDLRLELKVPEPWTAVPDAGDSSIRFRDKTSATEIRYQNLLVKDATGKKLRARLDALADGSGLTIHTSITGAVYPVTIDPLFTVALAANLAPGKPLTLGNEAPYIVGNTMYFTLCAYLDSSDKSSQGMWCLGLNGLQEPALRSGDNFPDASIMGVLNDKLYVSSYSGALTSWSEDGSGPLLINKTAGGNKFLSTVEGSAYYIRSGVQDGFWKTDGTAEGTILLRQLSQKAETSILKGAMLFYTNGKNLLFSSSTSESGTILQGVASVSLKGALILNNLLLFSCNGGISVVSESMPGTQEIVSSASVTGGTVLGAYAYFRKDDRLWRTDGSAGGTSLVSNEAPLTGDIIVNDGHLYFTGSAGAETSVWQSDGTAEGTRIFKSSAKIASAGKTLFYMLVTTPEEGEELWASNGTPEGTQLLKDITIGEDSTAYDSFQHAENQLLFRAGTTLWRSDGTTTGTAPLFTPFPQNVAPAGIASITPAQSKVFFTASSAGSGTELWSANPSTGAVGMVSDINPGTVGSNPYQMKSFGDGVILFFALSSGHGTQLWRSDGTPEGTRIVKDMLPGLGSAPTQLVVNGDTAWYFASVANSGLALCRTDGTAEGTALVKTDSSWQSISPSGLNVIGSGVVFVAPADSSPSGKVTVWFSDGTPEGTVTASGLPDLNKGAVLMTSEGKVFIAGTDGTSPGIWVAAQGTSTFTKFFEGTAELYFTRNSKVCFSTIPTPGVKTIRISDGTSAGTVTLSQTGEYYTSMANADGTVFLATMPLPDPTPYPRLRAFDFENPSTSIFNLSQRRFLENPSYASPPPPAPVSVKKIGFYVDYHNDTQLWASDGTMAGTFAVSEASPFVTSNATSSVKTSITNLTAAEDRLYYVTSNSAQGDQLRMITLTADLNVTASPAAGGIATGSLTGVAETGLKTISATPTAGYYFSHWQGNGITDLHAPTTTLNMQGPASATAFFRPIPQALLDWAASFGLSGRNSEPFATPAGDSTVNLLKYGFNLNPNLRPTILNSPATDSGLPSISLQTGEETRSLRIEFVRRKSGSLTYVPEISNDLNTWLPATAVPAVESLDETWEKVTIAQPVPDSTLSYFGRVAVSLN